MSNYEQTVLSLRSPSFHEIKNIAKNNCTNICPGKNKCKP